MTIYTHFEWNRIGILGTSFSIDAWWGMFIALMIVNLAPVIFVILGRRMKLVAIICSDSIKAEYTKISGNAISKITQQSSEASN